MYRVEDDRLLVGSGRYVEDAHPEDGLSMVVLRSPVGHGVIKALDVTNARAMDGVALILTGDDLDKLGVRPMASRMPVTGIDGQPMLEPERPALARGKVAYVGHPVAVIVAETPEIALDALEVIDLDINELPAAVDLEASAADGAPQIWDGIPGNRSFTWEKGDRAATETGFSEATHIVEVTVRHPRVAIAPIETRGCIAEFNAETGRYTLTTPSQGVVGLRTAMADYLGVAETSVRVITEDVGGSFAVKIWPYPEQLLALVAAREIGRPIKWISSRTESFVADAMGRGRVDRAKLALDNDGKFLAFRIDALADMGAFLNAVAPSIVTTGAIRPYAHVYKIPGLLYRVDAIFTNTMMTDAYRGAGKPESCSTLERLIDVAAEELGMDRVELRRKNLIQPADLPYDTPMGETYDGGDFPAIAEKILVASDWPGIEARRADSAKRGLLRGAGLGFHLHATGGSVAERSEVRALPDGSVLVRTGTQDSGQGHRTALAIVAAEALEVPVERIRVEQGDSDWLDKGGGTGGSNLMPIAGNTVHRTALKMIDQAKRVAAHMLEAAVQDVEYGLGDFRIAGTDRKIGLAEVAAGWDKIPADQRDGELGSGCVAQLDFEGLHTTFPNGAYVCEVEIDPDTGTVHVDRFTGVDDLGRVINEPTALGQLHGGIGQSVGEVLMEGLIYDEGGQILTGSLMDYALPRADQVPFMDLNWAPTDSPNALIGAKGVGEVSSIGAPGAIMNAVLDALRLRGVRHLDIPLTPEKIWRALQP
jgi:carbon-monoxide dehydrogenase large subunit